MNAVAAMACAQIMIGSAWIGTPDTRKTGQPAALQSSADASPIIMLTHSLDLATIEVGNSIACLTPTPPNRTFEGSFYRSFDLSQDPRVGSDLLVDTVLIGVEDALHPSGGLDVTVALYTDSDGGEPLLHDLVPLSDVTLTISDQVASVVSIPIEARVPAGSTLVVEVLTPSYAGLSSPATFVVGSNRAGQTAPTYWRSPACGFAQIIDVADPLVSGGFPEMHLVLGIQGTVDDACYADCDPSSGAGVLDIFDFVCFQDSFTSSGSYACDCSEMSGPGICDIFDFLCFQDAFLAGCP